MKTELNIFISLVFLLVFFGGAARSRAQDEPFAGGYIKVSPTDKQVIEAAKFAVQKRRRTAASNLVLVAVKNARQQVVAGMNYRICIAVGNKRRNKKTVAELVLLEVYRDLKNVYSLTSWAAKACDKQY